jgi:hypothetical protein
MPVKQPPAPHSSPRSNQAPKTYCGCCTGGGRIWCPDCYGFYGCPTCEETFKVACPVCSGGTLAPIRW